ncbi:rod shape-determining protein RodA [Candidatus Dojkabacteria bacterium]|nr:rod shape-determining protein RodA [Candidatus Dojkabacteria bacterium]
MQIIRKEKRFKISPLLIIPAIILSIIGIVTLISTGPEFISSGAIPAIATKQIIFVLIGITSYYLLSHVDHSYLKYKPLLYLLYGSTILLLILTLLFGEEVKGAQRWFSFGGVQLQPSEFAKIVVIIVTAYVMTLQDKYSEYALVPISLLLVLPILILVYMQPHGSMTLVLFLIWAITIFFSLREQFRNFLMLAIILSTIIGIWGILVFKDYFFLVLLFFGIVIFIYSAFSRKNWMALAAICFSISVFSGLFLSYSWNSILLPYQKERITSFISPESADASSTFNVDQAKIAIGSGRIFGKGFGKGTQASRDFLPEHQTDFIFASYAEQAGLLGSTILVLLYIAMFIAIFRFPIITKGDLFATTLVVALGMKILLEVFINLGTNMGITPATGIPLPLVSAGGSIMLATFFSLGLIQSIMNHKLFIDN